MPVGKRGATLEANKHRGACKGAKDGFEGRNRSILLLGNGLQREQGGTGKGQKQDISGHCKSNG